MTVAATEQHHGLALASEQDWWTEKQLAALRQIGVERASNGDLAVFMHVCQRTGLDPFARQIYMIQRDGKQVIQTGIDGMRLVARRAVDRTGEAFGIGAPEWCGPDGQWTDVWLSPQPPAAARVTVTRGDGTFTAIALWHEYVQTKRDGQITRMWATRGAGQLAKCAEALALRKACPQDLSGIYSEDEIAREHRERPQSRLGAVLDQTSGAEEEAPDQATAVDLRDDASAPESPLLNTSSGLARRMFALFGEIGLTEKADRLAYVGDVIGRQVASSTEMTDADAEAVIAAIERDLANPFEPVDAEVVEDGQ
jgi:phage recombination protein Bet